uniref:Putative SWI/SNF related protein n=1 Tax=Brachypodium distachyon TaxID=15368 RepID=C3SA95_BRADI|nr:putative SWI/SNF related protein [Brachypodium distachyon]
MQLRKCCNHPYLFKGAEPGPPYTTGDHLIESAGKMVLLDKLLPKLKARSSRVLIFSQMTRLLDILEDYLMYKGYQYCRIDGSTGGDDCDAFIEAFNKPESEKFIFLLSTRAGGLGINLTTADIVIIYDSDWNPQVDLQAQDRAHRIGQKKEVQVFRFCTEDTIEEKVIERAYKKLVLDALVIQQAINKDELLQMARFGAERIFSSKDSTITNEDIDLIIARGEKATSKLEAKMKKFTQDATKFKIDDTAQLYDFDDRRDEDKLGFKKLETDNLIAPPRRERKINYSENEYFKHAFRKGAPAKPREPRIPQMKNLYAFPITHLSLNIIRHDFQFFNMKRLDDLYKKEAKHLAQMKQKKGRIGDGDDEDQLEPLTEEKEEKEKLLKEIYFYEGPANAGFRCISRRNNYKAALRQKSYERIIKNIEKGESKISRKDVIMKSIEKKLNRYEDPWSDLKIQYGQNNGKQLYSEQCDRFMLCMVHKLGYGNWDKLKIAFRVSPSFRLDWFVKSRTADELSKRFDTLIRLVEKENQVYDEHERQSRKDNENMISPSKRPSTGGAGFDTPIQSSSKRGLRDGSAAS